MSGGWVRTRTDWFGWPRQQIIEDPEDKLYNEYGDDGWKHYVRPPPEPEEKDGMGKNWMMAYPNLSAFFRSGFFNELRGSKVCGQAVPNRPMIHLFSPSKYVCTLNGQGGWLVGKGDIPLDKFDGKWFGGEDVPEEEIDAFALDCIHYMNSRTADYSQRTGWRLDNVFWTKYMLRNPQVNMPRTSGGQQRQLPMFSDLCLHSNYNVGGSGGGGGSGPAGNDQRKALHLKMQWDHCVGQLGEDHPTCKKACWMYDHLSSQPLHQFFEEMSELGHFDHSRLWGIKDRQSFLPIYQNVKGNIPGWFEWRMSNAVIDKTNNRFDGTLGEWRMLGMPYGLE